MASPLLVSGHVTTCTHSYLYVSRYLYVSPFIAIYKTPLFTAINKMVGRGGRLRYERGSFAL